MSSTFVITPTANIADDNSSFGISASLGFPSGASGDSQ
jgi:hypothetical protein